MYKLVEHGEGIVLEHLRKLKIRIPNEIIAPLLPQPEQVVLTGFLCWTEGSNIHATV